MSNVASIRRTEPTAVAPQPLRLAAAPAPAGLTPLRRDSVQLSGVRAAATPAPLRPFTLNVRQLDAELDRATGTRVTHGNSVELHIDGKEAYPRMMALINSAQRTLHMEMYIFKDDEASWDIANALAERAQSGVKVRLTCDWIGSPVSSRIFDFLRANGVEVRHHTPLAANSQITHRKIVIADGQRAMTGGMNIAEEYRSNWHDAMVSIQGPAVHEMQRHFIETWHDVGGSRIEENSDVIGPLPATPAGSSELRVITTYPEPDIKTALFTAIDNARSHINMEMPYFSDDELVVHLAAAARRGVTVNLIIPGVSDLGIMDVAARRHFRELIDAGANIHLYQGRIMHTKATSVDGVWATIGSCNADNRSLRLHRELNVAISDPATVADLDQNLFARDFRDSRRVTEQRTSALGWITNQVVRLFNDQL